MKAEEIAVWAGVVVLVLIGFRLLGATAPRPASVFPDALNDDVDPDPVGGPLH